MKNNYTNEVKKKWQESIRQIFLIKILKILNACLMDVKKSPLILIVFKKLC